MLLQFLPIVCGVVCVQCCTRDVLRVANVLESRVEQRNKKIPNATELKIKMLKDEHFSLNSFGRLYLSIFTKIGLTQLDYT